MSEPFTLTMELGERRTTIDLNTLSADGCIKLAAAFFQMGANKKAKDSPVLPQKPMSEVET